jgi:GMP synthase (glutamine-hydrolysing)
MRPLLVVRHVPWEGPYRILDAFPDGRVQVVDVLDDDTPLPPPGEVCGAVFMGGPMSVNDVATYPRLAEEVAWLADAIARDLPVLGVCLGSQLIARAVGTRVVPAAQIELGFAPVDIVDPSDPLLGTLAPRSSVLHWHGEVFDLPAGAQLLARSALSPVQAFRMRNAWALLFHVEVNDELIENWIAEPRMAGEAAKVLGPDFAADLRDGARTVSIEASDALFAAFAERCAMQR